MEPTGISEDRQDSEAKRGEEGTLEGWTGRDEGLEVEEKVRPDQAQSPSPQDRMRQGEVGEHPHSGCNHLSQWPSPWPEIPGIHWKIQVSQTPNRAVN